MEILSVLKSKNRCLEKYLEASEAFWNQAEKGEMPDLAEFQSSRDEILKAMGLFEGKLTELAKKVTPEQRTPELVESVKAALDKKEALVHRILALDIKIIDKIEKLKENISTELNSARKSKDILSKFKSTWVNEGGEELDKKL